MAQSFFERKANRTFFVCMLVLRVSFFLFKTLTAFITYYVICTS